MLIQMGDSTHHQDQSIFPINLRTMNTMVSKPLNPMPLEDEDDLLMSSFRWVMPMGKIRMGRDLRQCQGCQSRQQRTWHDPRETS